MIFRASCGRAIPSFFDLTIKNETLNVKQEKKFIKFVICLKQLDLKFQEEKKFLNLLLIYNKKFMIKKHFQKRSSWISSACNHIISLPTPSCSCKAMRPSLKDTSACGRASRGGPNTSYS